MTVHKLNPQVNIKQEMSLRVNKVSEALFQVNRINLQDCRAACRVLLAAKGSPQ